MGSSGGGSAPEPREDDTRPAITVFYDDFRVWPANSDLQWIGKGTNPDTGNPEFNAKLWRTSYMGNTPAPKGHYIINPFYINREQTSGVRGIPTKRDTGTVSCTAFYAGRAWFSGVNSSLSGEDSNSSRVFFSQVIEQPNQIGKCHQEADPTSEEISDLIDTDGGTIRILGAGTVLALEHVLDSLIVIAENGVWQIANTSGNFTATSYSVNKITDDGCIGKQSIVNVGNAVAYWANTGIILIAPNNEGVFAAQNLTMSTIQSYYLNTIPAAGKQQAVGNYDRGENVVSWLYFEDPAYGGTTAKTHELNYRIGAQAFYKYAFASAEYRLEGFDWTGAGLEDKGTLVHNADKLLDGSSAYPVNYVQLPYALTSLKEDAVVTSSGESVFTTSGELVTAEEEDFSTTVRTTKKYLVSTYEAVEYEMGQGTEITGTPSQYFGPWNNMRDELYIQPIDDFLTPTEIKNSTSIEFDENSCFQRDEFTYLNSGILETVPIDYDPVTGIFTFQTPNSFFTVYGDEIISMTTYDFPETTVKAGMLGNKKSYYLEYWYSTLYNNINKIYWVDLVTKESHQLIGSSGFPLIGIYNTGSSNTLQFKDSGWVMPPSSMRVEDQGTVNEKFTEVICFVDESGNAFDYPLADIFGPLDTNQYDDWTFNVYVAGTWLDGSEVAIGAFERIYEDPENPGVYISDVEWYAIKRTDVYNPIRLPDSGLPEEDNQPIAYASATNMLVNGSLHIARGIDQIVKYTYNPTTNEWDMVWESYSYYGVQDRQFGDRAYMLADEELYLVYSASYDWAAYDDPDVDEESNYYYVFDELGTYQWPTFSLTGAGNTDAYFGELRDGTYVDNAGHRLYGKEYLNIHYHAYPAYIDTGYNTFEDPSRDKQVQYLTSFIYKHNLLELEDGTMVDGGGAVAEARWNFTSSAEANNTTEPFNLYKWDEPYILGDANHPGKEVVVAKNVVNGSGLSMSLHLNVPPLKGCHILGYSLELSARENV